MKAETHILDRDSTCARCGVNLPLRTKKARRGDRIGLLTGMVIPDMAYHIKKPEFDGNPFCVPMKDSIP